MQRMETETNHTIQESNITPSNHKNSFAVVLLLLIPLAVVMLTYSETNRRRINNPDEIVKIREPFLNVDILAKAAYVWDIEEQKVIYGKNEKEQLPLASLTKVMTALVALDGKDGLEKIKITSDSIKQEGDSGLKNEERWKLKDLIDFSLVTSSNDGIYAAASAIESQKSTSSAMEISADEEIQSSEQSRKNFIRLMNEKARDISLSQTSYFNETGLDSSDNESGGYGTAEDMAKLFAYIIRNRPEMLEATAYDQIELTSLDNESHKAQNTNEIVGAIPNVIASKTGYTDISGGNLVVAFDLGLMKPIVISVLGSTREGRFEDMEKLIKATMDYLTDKNAEN
ncbi:MAG: hypothetical protein HW401_335 [Parcubacteria group bacterium]|nr:hypothetical protein [Parcubacteria group bacterium]